MNKDTDIKLKYSNEVIRIIAKIAAYISFAGVYGYVVCKLFKVSSIFVDGLFFLVVLPLFGISSIMFGTLYYYENTHRKVHGECKFLARSRQSLYGDSYRDSQFSNIMGAVFGVFLLGLFGWMVAK